MADIDDLSDFIQRFVIDGKVKTIPKKQTHKQAMLQYVASFFERGRSYTESEVNEILLKHHDDYAYLRRGMIDAGIMSRSQDGREYKLS